MLSSVFCFCLETIKRLKVAFVLLLGLFCFWALVTSAQANPITSYVNNNDGNPVFKLVFYGEGDPVPTGFFPFPYTEPDSSWTLTDQDREAIIRSVKYWVQVLKPEGMVRQPVFLTISGESTPNNGSAVAYLSSDNMRAGAYAVLVESARYSPDEPQALARLGIFDSPNDYSFNRNQIVNRISKESIFIHEMGHALGINLEDYRFDSLLDGPDKFVVFKGEVANNVFNDNGPLINFVPMDHFSPYQERVHFGTRNTLMTHRRFRNYASIVEVEMAAIKDLGYDIDLRNFFGRSIYTDGNNITNNSGFFKSVKGVYQPGVPNSSPYALGLHLYGVDNSVIQNADLLADGPGSAGIRIDGTRNRVTINPGKRITANGARGTGVLVAYGSNNVLTNQGSIEATGIDGEAVRFDIGLNSIDRNVDIDGYGERAQYSYYDYAISPEDESYVEEFTEAMPFLSGPLVSGFDLSGSLKGAKSAVYISMNSHVKEINVLNGAEIEGAIITDYNGLGKSPSRSTDLNFGFLAGPDGRSSGLPDSSFNFSLTGTILGYGGIPSGEDRLYIGRGKFDLNFVGGRTEIGSDSNIRVNSFNVNSGACISAAATFDNRFVTVYSNSFDLASGSKVGLNAFSYGGQYEVGQAYPVLQLAFNGSTGTLSNSSEPDTSSPFTVGIYRYSSGYKLEWDKATPNENILKLTMGPNLVVERDRELAADYAVATPGVLHVTDPGWAMVMNHSRASLSRFRLVMGEAPASGDSSFNEGLFNQVWAEPFFSLTNRRSKGDSAGYELKTLGVALGYDHLFNENFTVGLAMTLNRPDYRSGGVKSDNRMLNLAAYGLTRLPGDLELNLALGNSISDYLQSRQVFGQIYGARYQGTAFRAGVSLARPFALSDRFTFSPRISYEYLKVKVDGYRENNVGPHALQVDGLSQNLHLTAFGAELAWQSEGGLALTGSLGGTRVGGDLKATSLAVFQADHHPFLATSDAIDKTFLNVGLGISAPLSQKWSLKAGYRGDFSQNTSSHSGEVAFNFQF